MKVLVIPDVHLKPYMFVRAKQLLHNGIARKAVCLMDIPDDFGKQFQLEAYADTFDTAIAFAKEFPETLWCYGNHDLCYLWDENETGYSAVAEKLVQSKLMELSASLPTDNPIQYVHKIDNVLFCHGGVAQYFVDQFVPKSKQDDVDFVVDRMNSLGHFEMWRDESPIWYRPQYYHGKMYKPRKLLQVVGHTPMKEIEKKGSVISTDVFSTYRDGRPIGTQEYLLIDTETKKFTTVK